MTPTELEWKEARSFCRHRGGDLALFYFGNVKRPWLPFDPLHLSGNVSVWFKMFSFDMEQRTPWHFNMFREDFSCSIFDIQKADYQATNCGTDISANKVTRKVGRCVLPPLLPDEFTCTGKCFHQYRNYCWEDTKVETIVYKMCPAGFEGTASWICGIDGQWLTPNPDLRLKN